MGTSWELKISATSQKEATIAETAALHTKDKEGTITQVLAFKKDLWQKVNKIAPTGEQLKAIEGKYQFRDDKDNYYTNNGAR